ncbi:gamma-glutamylcyclotransferase [Corticibacter populi]|uniref:Gamma-glutamylcyclotransferase n=2 Tax=Corticibacter populi TaxID=1550736 RepID=A0A3M6QGM2_9BURK|nr:gamma-glutamylcyclotransferase [Corticibacter populi]RZS29508.1 gamma-glutamyl AIG2-like cyclotransferase [Corticibacter populi]
MPLLFTYGTLQRLDIQRHVFGGPLVGTPDELHGHTRLEVELIDDAAALAGQTRYPMLRPANANAAPIAGLVYELSEIQLQRADHYEGPAYARVRVVLRSGREAWVYVDAQAVDACQRPRNDRQT